MQVQTESSGITFRVHNVKPADFALPVGKHRDQLKQLLESLDSNIRVPIESCSGYNADTVSQVLYHPFFCAVHLAFSQHRPLVLSPDMLWVTILQGFAIHINNDPEKYRHLLVKHEGREKIVVAADILPGTPENAWEGVIDQFGSALHKRVGTAYSQLLSDFTTTGELERVVCEVALMDVFQPYFEYIVMCVCGIPEITLEGTPADWHNLRQKIECLSTFDLDWWLPRLREIADQFCRAAQGDVDPLFWQNIYKLKSAYGGDLMNGWLSWLVPYLKCGQTGTYSVRNYMLEQPYYTPGEEAEPEQPFAFSFNAIGIRSSDLPGGFSQVPFKLVCGTGENQVTKEMQFIGGFLGVDQDTKTLALRPKFGWAVRCVTGDFSALDKLMEGATVFPPLPPAVVRDLISKLEPRQSFLSCIPGDLLALYRECNGIVFGDGRGRLLPLEHLELMGSKDVPQQFQALVDAHQAEMSAIYDIIQPWVRIFNYQNGDYLALELAEGSRIFSVTADGQCAHVANGLDGMFKLLS